MIKALEAVLADSYALYLKTQNYHWNVTGAEFRSLHLLFEDQYSELAEAIDLIAERIRTLGVKVSPLTHFIKLTSIVEAMPDADSEHMLQDLVKSQQVIVANLYKALDVMQSAHDEGTADILIERIKVHEKNKWMLESSLP